jgi:hypothetical protein
MFDHHCQVVDRGLERLRVVAAPRTWYERGMAGGKSRLSASVDTDVLAAAERAVAAGAAPNLSVWVTEAMRAKLDNDHRLRAMAEFIADYESRHGVITDEDIDLAQREARRRTRSVRGTRAGESRRKYGR